MIGLSDPSRSQQHDRNRITITVYILSHNQRVVLGQAIESVLNQTRVPDQILIVDDASTDGSAALALEFQHKHPGLIDIIINRTNLGIGSTRRLAVESSIGDYVTYLDGDDLYYPRKIELEERALLENPTAGYVYSNFFFIDENGKQTALWNESADFVAGDLFDNYMGFDFPRGVSARCELVRKDILVHTDHYESGLNLYQVNDTMMRVAKRASCAAVPEPTHAYRLHDNGVHRKQYTVHYDALKHIYNKNRPLLNGLSVARKKRINRRVKAVLSEYAWGSVRHMARSLINEPATHGPIYYATEGVLHKPASILNPKRISQFVRALFKASF